MENKPRAKRIPILGILLILFVSACNLPRSVPPTSLPLASTATPALGFLQLTPQPREQGQMIIRSVNFDTQFKINEVILDCPPDLAGAQIWANDQLVQGDPAEENGVKIILADSQVQKTITFVFKSGDQQLASCIINSDSLLSPQGDCKW